MISTMEIALKPDLIDAKAQSLINKAASYFNIQLDTARCVNILTLETDMSCKDLTQIRREIFTNPVTQVSSNTVLNVDFDWCIWIGLRPGVRDNAGSTALEAIKDFLGEKDAAVEGVYTSVRYCITGKGLSCDDMEILASQLLSNSIIQQYKIFSNKDWNKELGAKIEPPKVILNHTPCFTPISISSNQELDRISLERNLALHSSDIPVIRSYFLDPEVIRNRQEKGLSRPTDIELEYISQARSDHCNHNTFNGNFKYTDAQTNETTTINSLFKTYIKEPTLELKDRKKWVVSVLWDNAGVGKFDETNNYVITGETHNSPSNMEAYGGAITGIVGVYRDPLGTGLGAKLFMGSFGFCTGFPDYHGPRKPPLHPRRLLDGVIEGVKDGGNKSGVPTTFGQLVFDHGYMGKSLVFVTALGIMPAQVKGRPSHEKKTSPGDLIIMSGGRVGKDGIHGVTASSESYSENTPAGHVQIGDPYTQKKMHDFILECRDEGLISFITDNGGGGLSSSIGESAMMSNGCHVELDKVPLKYDGLDMWEIWISESQERMTICIHPENLDRFMSLSALHEVESTVIGEYSDTGKLHITYNGETCAYVDMDLLDKGFPAWEFDALWTNPGERGLCEPVISPPDDMSTLLLALLADPNIASKEWVFRQYDHEVQGGSVIKPLVGINNNIPSDACVTRPVLESSKGIAFSQAVLPWYGKIDTYHMTSCTIDETVRRLISVGGTLEHIGGVDNFCWPHIGYDPETNPDGKFKAAQLVRACMALKDSCMAYEIPLLSGKDSMYVDGHLEGCFGERLKVSALPTLQFSATSLVDDVMNCLTMDPKKSGDFIYLAGETANELGGSAYYALLGETGLNVPEVNFDQCKILYKTVEKAINSNMLASCHAVSRGGIAVHLALMNIAGGLGIEVDIENLPQAQKMNSAALLFSESAGRFLFTVSPEQAKPLEKLFEGLPVWKIGKITDKHEPLLIRDLKGDSIVDLEMKKIEKAFTDPFGDMI